jgi:hypothetical protein
MMKIVITDVTQTSLRFTVQAGDVVRQQKTLVQGDGSSVMMAGRLYRFEEVRYIWEKYSSQHDYEGVLTLPFAFAVDHDSFQQQMN